MQVRALTLSFVLHVVAVVTVLAFQGHQNPNDYGAFEARPLDDYRVYVNDSCRGRLYQSFLDPEVKCITLSAPGVSVRLEKEEKETRRSSTARRLRATPLRADQKPL